MPDHHHVRNHRHLQVFGRLLHDPNLWHFNRRSVAGAFANGLFVAFQPVPLQMILAAAGAIFFRVNLPLSVALVWVTNPLTMPPLFYFCYKVGAWVMRIPHRPFDFELSLQWFKHNLDDIMIPMVLGSLLCGTVAAIVGFVGIRLSWRISIIKKWKERRARKRIAKSTLRE